ncbi:MAG: hypothetical protein KGD59_02645 [Candidatus Heimdallarchaeota archaeon]|nr:hypothetical protein [Candidatus Heimdallarchaeota archaeon]MBY8993420.1 hypothetical protein [Candidatus Heimdallarchaeota archaeon]
MSTSENPRYLELRPSGIGETIAIAIIGLLLMALLLYIGITMKFKALVIVIPFVSLIGLWLLLYIPYRIYSHITKSIDILAFTSAGIVIHNKKFNILENISWSEIIDIIITKVDNDAKPEEVTVICLNRAEKINLKLYHTIFTSTENIWQKIVNIYEKHKEITI